MVVFMDTPAINEHWHRHDWHKRRLILARITQDHAVRVTGGRAMGRFAQVVLIGVVLGGATAHWRARKRWRQERWRLRRHRSRCRPNLILIIAHDGLQI